MSLEPGCPSPQGLYDPSFEHDACGVGFVVNVKGVRSHSIVRQALHVLINLLHRGACGCEANTGDGAGILIQMPDRFLRKVAGITLPAPGEYGAGLVFLPHDRALRRRIELLIEGIILEEGQSVLGWRDVPTNDRKLGESARAVAPVFKQLFVAASGATPTVAPHPGLPSAFERKLYVIRKRIEHAVDGLGFATSQPFY